MVDQDEGVQDARPWSALPAKPAWRWDISSRDNNNSANAGEIIGLFLNGWVSERYGYRKTVIACLLCIVGFTAIFFTAQNVMHLQVAEILCGVPWASSRSPVTTTYVSEVCPVALRG
ncbi:hypothetical protein C8J57DRAFT_1716489 [Mycena rebaudengoi]|nr:hypothetical protein C8J57DRAFT_1716489 [Mycena rebaudengoi]